MDYKKEIKSLDNNMPAQYVQDKMLNYMTLYTGRKFYPYAPEPEDIHIDDIAHALSRIPRYGGHLERFYTVGEHSLYCYMVAKKMGLSPLQCLYALLHDGSESIVNDVASPVKQMLSDYKKVEDGIMNVIWDMVGVPHPSAKDYHEIKLIDNTVLIAEMQQLRDGIDDLPIIETLDVEIDLSLEHKMGQTKRLFLEAYYDVLFELNQSSN